MRAKSGGSRFFEPWQSGEVVEVIAPASACARDELRGAIRFLKDLGLEPRVPRNIFGRTKIFSQTDDERFRQLQKALTTRDSRLIWCVRGGYGSIRLMPDLAKLKRPSSPKLLIGYSDITTLHQFFQQEWGWPSIHGPLLDRFGRGANRPQETAELLGYLLGTREEQVFRGLKPLNRAALSKRKLKGVVRGGNLAVLQSGLGTPWTFAVNKTARSLDRDGVFLFLEDIGERPHRLDRMLTQLIQSGVVNSVKSILFGPLQVSDPKDHKLIWQDVIPRFASQVAVPVLKGMPCGHGDIQRPLPFGTEATLQLSANGRANLRVRFP